MVLRGTSGQLCDGSSKNLDVFFCGSHPAADVNHDSPPKRYRASPSPSLGESHEQDRYPTPTEDPDGSTSRGWRSNVFSPVSYDGSSSGALAVCPVSLPAGTQSEGSGHNAGCDEDVPWDFRSCLVSCNSPVALSENSEDEGGSTNTPEDADSSPTRGTSLLGRNVGQCDNHGCDSSRRRNPLSKDRDTHDSPPKRYRVSPSPLLGESHEQYRYPTPPGDPGGSTSRGRSNVFSPVSYDGSSSGAPAVSPVSLPTGTQYASAEGGHNPGCDEDDMWDFSSCFVSCNPPVALSENSEVEGGSTCRAGDADSSPTRETPLQWRDLGQGVNHRGCTSSQQPKNETQLKLWTCYDPSLHRFVLKPELYSRFEKSLRAEAKRKRRGGLPKYTIFYPEKISFVIVATTRLLNERPTEVLKNATYLYETIPRAGKTRPDCVRIGWRVSPGDRYILLRMDEDERDFIVSTKLRNSKQKSIRLNLSRADSCSNPVSSPETSISPQPAARGLPQCRSDQAPPLVRPAAVRGPLQNPSAVASKPAVGVIAPARPAQHGLSRHFATRTLWNQPCAFSLVAHSPLFRSERNDFQPATPSPPSSNPLPLPLPTPSRSHCSPTLQTSSTFAQSYPQPSPSVNQCSPTLQTSPPACRQLSFSVATPITDSRYCSHGPQPPPPQPLHSSSPAVSVHDDFGDVHSTFSPNSGTIHPAPPEPPTSQTPETNPSDPLFPYLGVSPADGGELASLGVPPADNLGVQLTSPGVSPANLCDQPTSPGVLPADNICSQPPSRGMSPADNAGCQPTATSTPRKHFLSNYLDSLPYEEQYFILRYLLDKIKL